MRVRSVLANIIDWLKRWLKIAPVTTSAQQARLSEAVDRYEDTGLYLNRTATAAQALADMVIGESAASIEGANARSVFLGECLAKVWSDIRRVTARAMGTGQVMLYPGTDGRGIYPSMIDVDRMQVLRAVGDEIKSAAVEADWAKVREREYIRVDVHELADDGVYTIHSHAKAVNGDALLPLGVVPAWAAMEPEQRFGGVERMLFGVVRNATDNRQTQNLYGVPLTHGLQELLEMQEFFTRWLRDEFDLKQVRLGVSADLVKQKGRTEQETAPVDAKLAKLYMTFRTDPDGKDFFQVYDPATRHDAVMQAITFIDGLLEKGMGVNKGILTDLATDTATATAIRASLYGTWSRVTAMRKNIERGLADYLYACDVMANGNGAAPVIPAGDYTLNFDWDTSLLENTEETFLQLAELQTRGLVSAERLNMYVTGQDEEAARLEVAAAQAVKPAGGGMDIDGILNSAAVSQEATARTGLNGAQTQSLLAVMAQYASGILSLGQAVNVIATSIGVSEAEARKLLEGVMESA